MLLLGMYPHRPDMFSVLAVGNVQRATFKSDCDDSEFLEADLGTCRRLSCSLYIVSAVGAHGGVFSCSPVYRQP